jgi:hypothetical protein
MSAINNTVSFGGIRVPAIKDIVRPADQINFFNILDGIFFTILKPYWKKGSFLALHLV